MESLSTADVLARDLASLSRVLDKQWPTWKEETLQSISDERGIVREQVSLPIRAAIVLLERQA